MIERAHAIGVFSLRCIDRVGREVWRDRIENTVVDVGQNLMLDSALSGVNYTVVGPYLGFISSVGFSGIVTTDTLQAHPGWNEAGNAHPPTFSTQRPLATFAAAITGSKSLVAPASVVASGAGMIEGCFLVFGPGAVPLIDSTTGVLYSAGLGASAPYSVSPGDTIEVTYTTSL